MTGAGAGARARARARAGAGAGAGAGFWWAGIMAGLWEGQVLRCFRYSGLGSAVPAPMFLATQPPHAT